AIGLGCVFPNRPSRFLARLVALLAADAARRLPPPITLAGQPTATAEIPTPSPVVHVQCEPHIDCDSRLYRAEAGPSDRRGPYSRDKLLRMNARFVARVEHAIADGKENRAAASAGVIRRPPTP